MSKVTDSAYNRGYQKACADNFQNPYCIHTQNILYVAYNQGYAESVALMASCTAPAKAKG